MSLKVQDFIFVGRTGQSDAISEISCVIVPAGTEFITSVSDRAGIRIGSCNQSSITAASNPNITWEFSQQTDLGLEYATLNNRLKIEADYYNRDTKNLLLQLPIPGGSTGAVIEYTIENT